MVFHTKTTVRLTKMRKLSKCKYREKLYFTGSLFFYTVLFELSTFGISAQNHDQRIYPRVGADYKWPSPGDPDYRTYTFNDRRYGHYQPNEYANKYSGRNSAGQNVQGTLNGFDPNNPNTQTTLFPGILGGWREDLQGKQRRESLTLDRDVFVSTNHGQVQGFKVYMYDNPDPKSFYRPYHSTVDRVTGECSVFLGIPYSLPPVKEGRFKPPRLTRGWQLLQAVDFGPACPQPVRYTGATKGVLDMDEDCLYLNIYTPKTGAGIAQKYPVMVHIHGGEFIHGASNLFKGHVLSTFYNVIVVTFNYRLGALGFLSTADLNSPGNYGILDQAMALKWIYDNIEFFNGDRESITLFGPGAGAASAGLLMVAPQTKNIVKKVIAQSGSALADWAIIQDKYRAQNTSRVLGQLLGCSLESSWKLVNCLSGRSFYELGNAEFPPHVGTFPWGPVLDHNFTLPPDGWYSSWREKDWRFLSETPESLIQRGLFNHELHYMTGVTTQEAAFFISQNESLAPYYEIDEKFLDQKIRELVFHYNYTLNPSGVYEAIKYMYTYWPDPGNSSIIRDQYINMLSDFLYRAPVDRLVKLLLEKNIPVFYYILNTTVEALNLPQWRKYPHEIENYFLNGAPFMDVEFFPKKDHLQRNMWTDNDRNMSHFFMKSFTNFARYGNPTPEQILGIHFERAYQGELRYLNINTTYNSSIMMNYRQTELAFWTKYLPTVVGVLVPTYPPTTEYWWEPKEPLQIAFWTMSITCFFLIVLVFICCIMWRNAKRQSDRFYDEDMFINSDGAETDHDIRQLNVGTSGGIDNAHMVTNRHVMRSRDNIYEFRDTSSTKTLGKSLTENTSIRSPSSLGMTHKTGSQSSIKSAISLKDSNGMQSNKEPRNIRQNKTDTSDSRSTSAQAVRAANNGIVKTIEEKRLLQQDLNTVPSDSLHIIPKSTISRSTTPTPVPTTRITTSVVATTNLPALSSKRTQLIEGIPQTSV